MSASKPIKEKPGEQKGAQSIRRTVSLLRALARHNDNGARLSRLAREVDLHVATARRILQVLAEEGLVTYDAVSKLYHLGWEIYLLGNSARQYTIRYNLRPVLEKIAERTQDTVFLIVRSGNDALCIDMVQGSYPIRTMPIDIGSRRPLGIGAGSQALLSFLPASEREKIIESNGMRYQAFKGLTAQRIRSMCTETRDRGYGLSDGLFHEDVVSISVPVLDSSDMLLASVTISAIRSRMGESRREEIVEVAKQEIGSLF